MSEFTRRRLLETLDDLTIIKFREFNWWLYNLPDERGYRAIPKAELAEAGAPEVINLLFRYYNQDEAVEVAIEVLKRCNCNPQAKKLEEALSRIGNQTSTQPTQPSSSHEQHFINRFREQLIQRTIAVEQVLGQLHGVILNEEQYQKICSKETNQEKMRELYKLVPDWNRERKDQLYDALKSTDPFLIKDLEGR